MSAKLWELHGSQLGGAIRTTPEGEADIAGLVLSEKAYLLALRDFRPAQIVRLVREDGPAEAARALIRHYADDARGLALTHGMSGSPTVRRGDELREPIAARSGPRAN
jgi:hypothetical protein